MTWTGYQSYLDIYTGNEVSILLLTHCGTAVPTPTPKGEPFSGEGPLPACTSKNPFKLQNRRKLLTHDSNWTFF